MENAIYSAFILLCLPSFLYGESPGIDFSTLPKATPPMDATAGKMHEGIQIGLWTEKPIYKGDEIRNIWILARKQADSHITIGVGGSLFSESFVYVYRDNKEVIKFPVNGGVDGMRDPASLAGGISWGLKDLPNGTYTLIWKTDRFKSNIITFTTEQAEPQR